MHHGALAVTFLYCGRNTKRDSTMTLRVSTPPKSCSCNGIIWDSEAFPKPFQNTEHIIQVSAAYGHLLKFLHCARQCRTIACARGIVIFPWGTGSFFLNIPAIFPYRRNKIKLPQQMPIFEHRSLLIQRPQPSLLLRCEKLLIFDPKARFYASPPGFQVQLVFYSSNPALLLKWNFGLWASGNQEVSNLC